MVPRIDLYSAMRGLMEQIPEGMVTTPRHVAASLGDPVAVRAVVEAIRREELRGVSSKMVSDPGPDAYIFSEFISDRPLRKLAEIQQDMAERLSFEDGFDDPSRIAGVDVAYNDDEAFAACVVMDTDLRVVEKSSTTVGVHFPYIPGYLMFREAPAVESVIGLVSGFDVLFVNGHGVAHPRGCGLATCVGLEMSLPTIGVAKSLLEGKVGDSKEDWAPVVFEGRVVGAEILKGGHPPIYVSVGHMVSLETSVKTVLKTLSRSRLPEPLVRAHVEARIMLNAEKTR